MEPEAVHLAFRVEESFDIALRTKFMSGRSENVALQMFNSPSPGHCEGVDDGLKLEDVVG